MSSNNTGRFPRTLGEAFGGNEYACAIERHLSFTSRVWLLLRRIFKGQ